jgi:hypothetical protein
MVNNNQEEENNPAEDYIYVKISDQSISAHRSTA